MKQAVMMAPGCIEIREVPAPSPGAGQVLVRIRRIGVCGSDVHVYQGQHPYTKYPVIQGHEFAGVVAAVGAGVEDIYPGTKVTATPQIVCGHCPPCRRGDYHICNELKVQGFQAPGCAQELFVTEADRIVQLPDNLSFEQGALVEPTAVAMHAVSRAGDLLGKNALVLGAGPIGNLVAQVARSRGASVLITDLSDYRLGVAKECGLSATSNARGESLQAAVSRVFGSDGFSVCFECVGTESTISAAVEAIEKGGTIVIVGVFGDKPQVDLGVIQDRELNLCGTLMYQRRDYVQAVESISALGVVTEPLLSRHFDLQGYAEAYAFISSQRDQCLKVFIDL